MDANAVCMGAQGMVCGSLSSYITQSSQYRLDHVSLKEMRELLCTWVLKVSHQKDWCKEGSDFSDAVFISCFLVFLEGI